MQTSCQGATGGSGLLAVHVCTKWIKTCSSLFIHPGFSAPLQVALAVSLNLRTYLHLNTNNDGKVCINLPNIDTFLSWDLSELKQLIPYMCGKRWWSTFIHCDSCCYALHNYITTILQYLLCTLSYMYLFHTTTDPAVCCYDIFLCNVGGHSGWQVKERRPNVWMLNSWGGYVNFWIYPMEAWIHATWPS